MFVPSRNPGMSKLGTERPPPPHLEWKLRPGEGQGRTLGATGGAGTGTPPPGFSALRPQTMEWVTVYFGAWAVLIFSSTHSISKGQRAAGMEEVLAPGYFWPGWLAWGGERIVEEGGGVNGGGCLGGGVDITP